MKMILLWTWIGFELSISCCASVMRKSEPSHPHMMHWRHTCARAPLVWVHPFCSNYQTACSICASNDRNERGRPKVLVIFGIGCVGNPRNVFYATRHMCRFLVPDGNWLTAHDRSEHTAAWLINERMASVSQWTRFGSLTCTTRCPRHTQRVMNYSEIVTSWTPWTRERYPRTGGGIIATVVVVRSGSIVCVCVCCVTLAIVAQSRRRNATCNGFAP